MSQIRSKRPLQAFIASCTVVVHSLPHSGFHGDLCGPGESDFTFPGLPGVTQHLPILAGQASLQFPTVLSSTYCIKIMTFGS